MNKHQQERQQTGDILLTMVRSLRGMSDTSPARVAVAKEYEAALMAVREGESLSAGKPPSSKRPKRKPSRR